MFNYYFTTVRHFRVTVYEQICTVSLRSLITNASSSLRFSLVLLTIDKTCH